MKNKKAMIGSLISLGIGIMVIAVIVTIGIVVLGNFADSQSACTCSGKYNPTTGVCDNTTSGITSTCAANLTTWEPSIGTRSAFYAEGKLGNSTGGLLTWLPVIIPAIIGIGIIGYFMTMKVKA